MRGQFALEDGDFPKAAEYFERALDQNPQDGNAYLGKVLAALHLSDAAQIDDHPVKIHDDKNFDRAIRFTDPATSKVLTEIRERAHRKYLIKCFTVGLREIQKVKKAATAQERKQQERQEQEQRERQRREWGKQQERERQEREQQERQEREQRVRQHRDWWEQQEREQQEQERMRKTAAELQQQKATLQAELANLKGLFTGKRRREIESRLAEIDAELKNL